MKRPPNVLFILCDDLGWRDLGCSGSSFYETPHLDALARAGMQFSDAYASCPVCSPSRASILTGQYPARVGITNFIPGNACGKLMGVPYFEQLPTHHVTVAQVLKEAGYQTFHVGKWHVGRRHLAEEFGFDVNVAGNGWGLPQHGYFSPYKNPKLAEGPDGEYMTDRLTDEAIRLIENADRGRPFFMHLCHYAPHTPIQAPEPLVEKYRRKAKRLGLDQIDPLVQGESLTCLHKHKQHVVRRMIQSDPTYAAMIESIDTNVGRLLQTLARLSIEEETIVVFTSDNGGLSTQEGSPTCNLPLAEGKGWMQDGGVRVPLIFRWPGRVAAGSTSATPVTGTDFFPTFLEAAGLPPRPDLHVDGVSLMPALTGTGEVGREAIFWHYPHYSNQGGRPACAVRSGAYKLIEYFEDGRLELYDLPTDPAETRDLSQNLPDVTSRLHALLVAWRDEVEAKIPAVNPHFEDILAGRMPTPDGAGVIPGDDRFVKLTQ